jgi:hypothetical protein
VNHRQLIPDRERLRRAVQWMSDTGEHTMRSVEEASRRFDLSPLDEEFLLQHFVWKPPTDPKPGGCDRN